MSFVRPHYLAPFDPWLETPRERLEETFKFALLTSQKVACSDNQLLNNPAFQRMLARPDIRDFLMSPEWDGTTPLMPVLRRSAESFEDVLKDLLWHREKPARLMWLRSDVQMAVDALYSGRSERPIDEFIELAGPEFAAHLDRLNGLVRVSASETPRWQHLPARYIELAHDHIRGTASQISDSIGLESDPLQLACNQLLKELSSNPDANRSMLFRVLSALNLGPGLTNALAHRLLFEPYHRAFVSDVGCHLFSEPPDQATALGTVFPEFRNLLRDVTLEEVLEVSPFPVSLSQISYERLHELRSNAAFGVLLGRIAGGEPSNRLRATRDFLQFVSTQLAEDASLMGRLSKVRLTQWTASSSLRERLASSGLSLSDAVTVLGRSAGFFAGELVGQLIGIFGIGGIAGTTTAIVIERCVDRSLVRPHRRGELERAVQLLCESGSTPQKVH